MLTMHDDSGFARDALAAGASGYVLKDAAERQLVDAIRAVVAGRGYLDPGLGARAIAAPRPREPATRPGCWRSGPCSRVIASTGSPAAAGWASSTGSPISCSAGGSR